MGRVSVLDYPPRIGSPIRCITSTGGHIWTNGSIDKTIIVPQPGRVYTVRSNVLSSAQYTFPVDVGVLLTEVVNKLIEYRKGTNIEPFWPRSWFVPMDSSHP